MLCVGAGQLRYKFKQEQRFLKSSRPDSEALVFLGMPSACPSNEMTLMVNAFLATIKQSTDLRYNLWWSFGMFLEDGTNEALDRAIDAVTTAHSSFCAHRIASVAALTTYSIALQALRNHLNDPVQAHSSNTLCAVMVLLVCQSFIGYSGHQWSGHAEGAARILQARKYFGPRDEFERKLFLSLRGSVVSNIILNIKFQRCI